DLIAHDGRPTRIDRHADRPSARFAVIAQEACNEIDGLTRWPAVAERHEHHFEADRLAAIATAMLTDERALGKSLAHRGIGESETARRHVRAERVIRRDRRGDLLRILPLCTLSRLLPPIATRPPIARAVAHGRQRLRYEIGSNFVPLIHDSPKLARLRLDREGRRVAQPFGIALVHAGPRIDLPHDCPIDFRLHPALRDIAVRSNPYEQEAS